MFYLFIGVCCFLFFMSFCLVLLAYYKSGEPYESKIYGLFGKRGQGKTLYAVKLIYQYLKTTPLPIYYELALDKDYVVSYFKKKYKMDVEHRLFQVKFDRLSQLVDFMRTQEHAVLIFDEAHKHFPSDDRSSAKERADIRVALNVSRHRDVTLIYITQKFNSVNTQLRLVTDRYFFASKTWNRFTGHNFKVTAYEQELFQPPRQLVDENGNKIKINPTSEHLVPIGDAIPPSKKLYKFYNTKGSGDLKMLVNDM